MRDHANPLCGARRMLTCTHMLSIDLKLKDIVEWKY